MHPREWGFSFISIVLFFQIPIYALLRIHASQKPFKVIYEEGEKKEKKREEVKKIKVSKKKKELNLKILTKIFKTTIPRKMPK